MLIPYKSYSFRLYTSCTVLISLTNKFHWNINNQKPSSQNALDIGLQIHCLIINKTHPLHSSQYHIMNLASNKAFDHLLTFSKYSTPFFISLQCILDTFYNQGE